MKSLKECVDDINTQLNGRIIDNIRGNFGIVCYIVETDTYKYYILAKEKFFMSFGKIYHKSGVGMGASRRIVEMAANDNAYLVFYMTDSDKIYKVKATDFMEYAMVNNTIHTIEKDGDDIMSVSVKMLERFKNPTQTTLI